MERWQRESVWEILRENINPVTGRPEMSPYGLAIRFQQQLGMSWEEATAASGYRDTPSRIYTPKQEIPSYPVSLPVVVIKDMERRAQMREKQIQRYNERRKKQPSDRINELMALMKTKEKLLAVRDNNWCGAGEVDENPTIEQEARMGVLMLRAPYMRYITTTNIVKTRNPATVTTTITTKAYEDFASVRAWVQLPKLSETWTPSCGDLPTERIGIQILDSNLRLYIQEDGERKRTATVMPIGRESVPGDGFLGRREDAIGAFADLKDDQKPDEIFNFLMIRTMRRSNISVSTLGKSIPSNQARLSVVTSTTTWG